MRRQRRTPIPASIVTEPHSPIREVGFLDSPSQRDGNGSVVSEEPRDTAQELPARSEHRYLGVLRWVLTFAVITSIFAMISANITLTSDPNESQLAIGVGILATVALLTNMLIAGAERRARGENERIRSLWKSRHAELQDIASRDDLTQLQNRRFFYDRLQQQLDQAIAARRPLSVIMIDVDDLKAVNDEFGHQIGDAVLRSFARILNTLVDGSAITARLGGDEFAAILPGADRRQADQLAWRLWSALSETPIVETEHASIFLGVSVGTSGYPWGGNDIEEIIHWADTKLYANKLERKGFKQPKDYQKDSRLVGAVVDVLSTALDVRDRMTHRHARRAARMAAFLAREMQLSEHDILEVEYAAALHDIGKIGVADEILRKAEPLNSEEWREMRRHSELGYQILNGIDFLKDAAEIVYSHHEWFDGTGYPRGLAGEEIPLGARIFAVVDAFDAMTSRRPYRNAMPREVALMEIARNAGAQFDPMVVEAFLVMARRNPDGFRGEEGEYGAHIVTETHPHKHPQRNGATPQPALQGQHEHSAEPSEVPAGRDLVRR
jgi:diguanylate cyclase (GGDEF)-like protein